MVINMYVAVTGKGKYRVIQFCEQHRIPKTNKKKTTVIKTVGNYEELLKKNPNIISELKEEVKRITIKNKEETCKNILFRVGHTLIHSIWNEIGLSKILEESLLQSLFSLVVYRLGSSYSTFLENRKIPFLNLKSISHLDFYGLLLKLKKKEKILIKYFNKFFDKKIKREKKIIYYHTSNYNYDSYWKILYGSSKFNSKKGCGDTNFDMILFFDSYGFPIFYQLSIKKDLTEKKIENIKKRFKMFKFISVSTEENTAEKENFIMPILFKNLRLEVQKEILSEKKWKILKKDIKTNQILEKDKTINLNNNLKIYSHWSKKRAFKDYIEKNDKNGYIYLLTDEENIEHDEISNIFQHTWNIEDKFKITGIEFSEKHLHGHFILCFICLSIIRYFQYLLGSNGKEFVPMIYAHKAISNPMIFMKKKGNNISISPIHLTNSYLKLSNILGLGEFSEEMSIEKFEKKSGLKIKDVLF